MKKIICLEKLKSVVIPYNKVKISYLSQILHVDYNIVTNYL